MFYAVSEQGAELFNFAIATVFAALMVFPNENYLELVLPHTNHTFVYVFHILFWSDFRLSECVSWM